MSREEIEQDGKSKRESPISVRTLAKIYEGETIKRETNPTLTSLLAPGDIKAYKLNEMSREEIEQDGKSKRESPISVRTLAKIYEGETIKRETNPTLTSLLAPGDIKAYKLNDRISSVYFEAIPILSDPSYSCITGQNGNNNISPVAPSNTNESMRNDKYALRSKLAVLASLLEKTPEVWKSELNIVQSRKEQDIQRRTQTWKWIGDVMKSVCGIKYDEKELVAMKNDVLQKARGAWLQPFTSYLKSNKIPTDLMNCDRNESTNVVIDISSKDSLYADYRTTNSRAAMIVERAELAVLASIIKPFNSCWQRKHPLQQSKKPEDIKERSDIWKSVGVTMKSVFGRRYEEPTLVSLKNSVLRNSKTDNSWLRRFCDYAHNKLPSYYAITKRMVTTSSLNSSGRVFVEHSDSYMMYTPVLSCLFSTFCLLKYRVF